MPELFGTVPDRTHPTRDRLNENLFGCLGCAYENDQVITVTWFYNMNVRLLAKRAPPTLLNRMVHAVKGPMRHFLNAVSWTVNQFGRSV
jgi:hypothetical protein